MAYDEKIRSKALDYWKNGKRSAEEIRTELTRDATLNLKDEEVPNVRTLERWIPGWLKDLPPDHQALESEWQLQPVMYEGISPDDVPILLEIKRRLITHSVNGPLTVRAARWVTVVRRAAPDLSAYSLWIVANYYASSERFAKAEHEAINTSIQENYLTFAPWRSPEAMLAYEFAVNSGVCAEMPLTAWSNTTPPQLLGVGLSSDRDWPGFAPHIAMKGFFPIENGIPPHVPDANKNSDAWKVIVKSVPTNWIEPFNVFALHANTLLTSGDKTEDEFLADMKSLADCLIERDKGVADASELSL